jgi:hypothetical protein
MGRHFSRLGALRKGSEPSEQLPALPACRSGPPLDGTAERGVYVEIERLSGR